MAYAGQVPHAATRGGARTVCLGAKTGFLEVGKKADTLVLDLANVAFTPRNDIANHLVSCETGSSITHAIVNGEVVAEGGVA